MNFLFYNFCFFWFYYYFFFSSCFFEFILYRTHNKRTPSLCICSRWWNWMWKRERRKGQRNTVSNVWFCCWFCRYIAAAPVSLHTKLPFSIFQHQFRGNRRIKYQAFQWSISSGSHRKQFWCCDLPPMGKFERTNFKYKISLVFFFFISFILTKFSPNLPIHLSEGILVI